MAVRGVVVAQQGTASIGGKVADQGGGVLPGVTIVITNEDTGINREVMTGVDGSYFASQVNPGRYRVSAKLEGFKTLERRGISLEVGRTSHSRFDARSRRARGDRDRDLVGCR